MKKHNQKHQNKDSEWIMEEELEKYFDYDDEYFDGDEKTESVTASENAHEKLKNFIQELYERQENPKKV